MIHRDQLFGYYRWFMLPWNIESGMLLTTETYIQYYNSTRMDSAEAMIDSIIDNIKEG